MKRHLIIDNLAMEKIAKKLEGQPIYADKSGNLFKPGIIDILDEEINNKWQPLNENSKKLILSIEACKDIMFYFNELLEEKTRKRAMKRMSVPICSLIDLSRIIIALANKNKDAREHRDSSWPEKDKTIYKKLSKRINKMNSTTPIRKIRNKQAAHLDSDIFHENPIRFKYEDILEPLGDCIVILMLSTNYPSDFFHWIRCIGESKDKMYDIVETMYSYPLSVQLFLDKSGHVVDVNSVNLSSDPRHEVRDEIVNIIGFYNKIIKLTMSNLSEIYVTPTEELLKNNMKI